MIENMFRDIATRSELLTVNELYSKGNKGSAIVFMLKRIKRQWNKFLGREEKIQAVESPRKPLKINQGGISRYI